MPATLLAVTGRSPAVVTETLWALARQAAPVLPERVVMVTTVTGAAALEDQLFTPVPEWDGQSAWERLRTALGAGEGRLIAEPVAVITRPDGTSGRARPLEDIRTPVENDAAAEFIFSRVWEVVRDPDRQLIASVAGGRKTMGALLHAAVSLIGREHDRVTHVLVDAAYENLPGFLFPGQPGGPLVHRDGRALDPAAARVMLADVPFVPLRNRFGDLDDLPTSFESLRRELSRRLAVDAEREVPIRIDYPHERLEVDGHPHHARPRALAVLHFILKCQEKGQRLPDQQTAAEAMTRWLAAHPEIAPDLEGRGFAAEDIRRELSHLRSLLKGASWKPASRTLHQAPFSLELRP